MATVRLTKRTIDDLSSDGKATGTLYWDSDLAGFGIRVYPNGKRKFVLKYRTAGGRQRWLTLGAFGPLTADRARELAKLELAKVIEGQDPAAERQARRDAITMAQLCDKYLEAARAGLILGRGGTPKKQSTIDSDESRIRAQIKPLLGQLVAGEVQRPDIERFKADVVSGKAKRDIKTKRHGRSIVKGGRGTSTRTLGLLGSMFSWGVDNGFVSHNPVQGVRRFADNKRKALLTADQYRWLALALDALATEHHQNGEPMHCARGLRAIRFIALCGLRRGEASNLQWTEVDQDGRCLGLGETKTGFSLRPLGQAAYQVIAELNDRESEFVFPSADGTHGYRGLPNLWRTVRKKARALAQEACTDAGQDAAGPLDGLSLHSLRHSYAGMAEALGASLPTIGALLGHSAGRSRDGVGGAGGVTGGYILKRLDMSLIDIADRLAGHIARAMAGEAVSAEIIAFRPRAVLAAKTGSAKTATRR